MKNFFKNNNDYLKLGITALGVIAVALVCNHLLSKWDYVMNGVSIVARALRPIFLGVVFAYVLNPLMTFYEEKAFQKLFKKTFKEKETLAGKISRGVSIFAAFVTAIAVIAGLITMIIPELYQNVQNLIKNMPIYAENAIKFIRDFSNNNPEIAAPVQETLEKMSQGILSWATDTLLPNVDVVITNISKGIYGTFKIVLDVILGMIVAVYLLAAKEKYFAGVKKYLHAIFKKDTVEKIVGVTNYADSHFGGFLVGKILDSAIIGVLSFIVFSIFGMPYVLLISVIIGVTNVIPFFGPFLGAIPCGLLILLVDPVKAIVFAILILAIQQLDGNVIGPKILGDKTGLDSFAVVFSILVFGGLFGIVGMIIGVPTFATIFGLVTRLCNKRLVKKNLPVEVDAYKSPDGLIAEKNKEE